MIGHATHRSDRAMRHFPRLHLTALAVTASLLLPLSSCSLVSSEDKKSVHRRRGLAFFEKGQYQEALIEFQNVIQLDPKDPDGHYRAALTYLKLGGLVNLRGAFAELSNTTVLDPLNRDAHLKLASLYLLDRDPVSATEQADTVLESAPEDVDALVVRARGLVGTKDYENAIKDFKKAIELDPKSVKIRLNLARTYVIMKDPRTAEAVLKEALTLDPQSVQARLDLGDLHALTGRLEEAERDYKGVMEITPDQLVGYTKLAGFYHLLRRWTDAEQVYLQYAARKNKEDTPQILLGNFYAYMGQHEKARAAYQRAAELNPNSTVAKNSLIDYDLKAGKLEQAEAEIKPILEKHPGDLIASINDARVLLARGKTEDTLALLQRIVADAPHSAGAHYYFGLALLENNDLAQARRELTEAVKLAPDMYEARTALAKVHLAEGSVELTIAEAKAAIRLNPLRTLPVLILGDAYISKNDLPRARAIFEAFTKAAPREPIGFFKLGVIARLEKRDADALPYFEQALLVSPDFLESLDQIVRMKLKQGKPREARERIMQQIDVSPKNPAYYNLQGLVAVRLRDFTEAEASFKKAIELEPNQTTAYLHLAELYTSQGKAAQAIQEYEGILAKNPGLLKVQVLLGVMYERQQQYEKAKARYEAALAADPKFWPAANNLAYLLSEHGAERDLDAALAHAEKARTYTLDPNIADTLGWIYFKKKHYRKAVDLLKEAAPKLADQPTVQYHYGMALLRNGDRVNARKTLEAALKLSDSFPGAEDAKKKLKIL
jgi:tetratricopeptide (TPR) repeat protein